MKQLFITIVICISSIIALALEQVVPYTLADRDRLIKVESKLDALAIRVDSIERNLDKRIDRLVDKFDLYFTWGFGLVLGALFGLFGFIIYDRRTTLAPVKREQEKLLEALKELGKNDPNIREALKRAAIL